MPVNDHLKWVEIKDFSGGLADGQDFLIPPDKFATMEDCYARKGGGLRAFFKGDTTSIPTTGIGSLTTERIEMVYPLLESTGVAWMCVTKNTSTGLQKWYTMGVGANSWTLRKTFTAPASFANSSLTQIGTYNTGAGIKWAVTTSHNKSDSSEDGLYTVTDAGVIVFVENSAFNSVAMTQYQARLVYAKLNTLVWTDPGSIAVPAAANFLTLQSGNNDIRDIIVVIVPYAPTTLIVGTVGSGWWMIEGDLTDPVVRQMGDDHYPSMVQRGVRTEDGIVFFEPNNGIYKTRNMGANFDRLDAFLAPHTVDQNQAFTQNDNFLFAPNGRVLDIETDTWFTLSAASGSTPINHWVRQPQPGVNGLTFPQGVLGPQRANGAAIVIYPVNEKSGQRSETYTVKTAPMRDDSGRQMAIREVQVGVDAFGSASTIAVTVDGVTQTCSAMSAGKNVISFLFNPRNEYQDVKVIPNSNATNVEAPVLEYIRIGARVDGHQIHY